MGDVYIYHCMFAGMSIFRKDQGIFMDRENQSSDIGAVDLQTFKRSKKTIGWLKAHGGEHRRSIDTRQCIGMKRYQDKIEVIYWPSLSE
jgi:hypothetical protein